MGSRRRSGTNNNNNKGNAGDVQLNPGPFADFSPEQTSTRGLTEVQRGVTLCSAAVVGGAMDLLERAVPRVEIDQRSLYRSVCPVFHTYGGGELSDDFPPEQTSTGALTGTATFGGAADLLERAVPHAEIDQRSLCPLVCPVFHPDESEPSGKAEPHPNKNKQAVKGTVSYTDPPKYNHPKPKSVEDQHKPNEDAHSTNNKKRSSFVSNTLG